MLLKVNFYEGVPVGPSDFSEFFSSVKKNVDALLIYTLSSSLAQNNLSANGGYVVGGELELVELSGHFVLRSANQTKKGILFARDPATDRYFVEEYPYFSEVKELPVQTWEILATGNDKTLVGNDKSRVELVYPASILPRFPVMWEKDDAGNYNIQSRRFYSVRYNGIPQKAYDLKEQSLVFTKLKFGAEYPHPLNNKNQYVDTEHPKSFSEWIQQLGQNGVIYLRFPNANFNIDTPILLLRETFTDANGAAVSNYHAIREDKSYDNDVATNSFKVIDRAKGTVKVKLTEQFIKYVLKSSSVTPLFEFIVPEQLVSVINNGVVEYKTRYGAVYNGDVSQVELLSLNFRGNDLILNKIVDDLSNTPDTDTLYVDRARIVGDILLAISYEGRSRVEISAQRNKFFPDVITLFYSTAVPVARVAGASQVRLFVESNKASWYNQNVALAEYRPVHRMDRSNLTMIGSDPDWNVDASSMINPMQPLTISNSALPAYTYAYRDKVTLGTIDKYARVDAAIPEPHYVNPTIVKMTLPADEVLVITNDHQMSVHRRYKVEGRLVVDGFLIIE